MSKTEFMIFPSSKLPISVKGTLLLPGLQPQHSLPSLLTLRIQSAARSWYVYIHISHSSLFTHSHLLGLSLLTWTTVSLPQAFPPSWGVFPLLTLASSFKMKLKNHFEGFWFYPAVNALSPQLYLAFILHLLLCRACLIFHIASLHEPA